MKNKYKCYGLSSVNRKPTLDKLDFMKHNEGSVILQYEPKFDVELDKIPDDLYHLTPCDKLKKIMKIGLTPRTSTQYFTFENRIYLTTNKDALMSFANQKQNITQNDCFKILKINLNGYTNRIRFFRDPNFHNGIYTLENIPAYVITPIETIKLNPQ